MTDKKFYEYLKTISKELTEEFSEDLFYNKGLTRFLDVEKKMRSMKVVYRLYRIQINDIYNQNDKLKRSSLLSLAFYVKGFIVNGIYRNFK